MPITVMETLDPELMSRTGDVCFADPLLLAGIVLDQVEPVSSLLGPSSLHIKVNQTLKFALNISLSYVHTH